ncbi:uncharacterized protein LOC119656828 isoform X1 [Hermetia illucens]|uniref:uncharacterized protein LOC119656828 isoform X1 n=2 Tax=Hermetia illucens TaxID=343691 RepID=UPI0018CC5B88|nr:uncharacterized protein LOC119656828 isoform X1 [Hermetia illucens]
MNRTNSFVNALKWWPMPGGNNKTTFGSSVAVQKLRESKWFGPEEQRIFCAVVEYGFIVEIRSDQENNGWFGVVVCKSSKDKKALPETIEIFSVKLRGNGLRVFKITLEDVWKRGWYIRINNFADKEKQPHCEKDIRDQITFARKANQSLWNNTQHFAYWCRYGSRQQDIRRRQMSECVKWGSVGMNAGMLLVMNSRQKSWSTSK